MTRNCIVCDNPTKSHHVVTFDGVKQYCCHGCWQRRDNQEIQDALQEYDALTGTALEALREEYHELTTPTSLSTPLPDLPGEEEPEFRHGAGGDVFEWAGAVQNGREIDFDGRIATVVPIVDLPRDPLDTVYTTFGHMPAGDPAEDTYLAWLCIGDDSDDLANATTRIASVLQGDSRV